MSRENSPSTSRRKEYLAEHWSDDTLLSSEEVVLQQTQQADETKSKKKKSRGNRQQQRSRAKLRKQVLPKTTTVEIPAHKRKRDNVSKANVPTSTSTISLLQPSMKRTRPNISSADVEVIAEVTVTQSAQKKANYLSVSDPVLKQMLSTTLPNIDENSILPLLDTPEKIQYVRTYAQLVNDLFYLKMKDDFWKHYQSTITSSEIGSKTMPRSVLKEYHLDRLQFVKPGNILKHQQVIADRLKRIEQQLNEHKQQAVDIASLDISRLASVIPAFVRQGQRKLSADFERKKLLLQFDVNDYCLVYAFYNLKPSTDQVMSAKHIWQATVKQQQNEQCLAMAKQRIYTKRFPSSFHLLDHSIDPETERALQNSDLHVDKRVALQTHREKMIARFKYDLLTVEIQTMEELIRTYSHTIADEKKKLTDAAHGQAPLPKFLVDLLNAIAARQSNIVKRAQLITKQKLSFFEYAPTVAQDKEVEQVTGDMTVGAATV